MFPWLVEPPDLERGLLAPDAVLRALDTLSDCTLFLSALLLITARAAASTDCFDGQLLRNFGLLLVDLLLETIWVKKRNDEEISKNLNFGGLKLARTI